jgi:hypothetical protein
MNTIVVIDSNYNMGCFMDQLTGYYVKKRMYQSHDELIVSTESSFIDAEIYYILDTRKYHNNKDIFKGLTFDQIEMYICEDAEIAFEIYNEIYLPRKSSREFPSGYSFKQLGGSKIDTKDLEFDYRYFTLPEDTHVDLSKYPTNIQVTWLDPVNKECEHNWKEYVGLVESYKYCSKCNKKE